MFVHPEEPQSGNVGTRTRRRVHEGPLPASGVDVKIRMVRSKNAFALMAAGADPDFKILLTETFLQLRNAKLNPTVQLGHIKAITKGTAKYPLCRVDCDVFSIPRGIMIHIRENVYLGMLPNRVLMCLIENDAYNGTYNKNRFNVKHNDVNILALYVVGRQVSSKLPHSNFTVVAYVRNHQDLFAPTGKAFENEYAPTSASVTPFLVRSVTRPLPR